MEEEESVKIGEKLAPFNPTSDLAITQALEYLNLTDKDVLYDLGCGDGRFLFRACEEVFVFHLARTCTLYTLNVFIHLYVCLFI